MEAIGNESTPRALATYARMSRLSFCAMLGRTIKAEITRVRIDRAKLLLQETELPVGKVATRTGFSEPKYFCEVFRKAEGVTAGEYRKKFRQ